MLLRSGGLTAEFVSIQPETPSMALRKAWHSIHLDKELPPTP